MRIRLSSVVTGFTVILAGASLALLHRTTCNVQPSVAQSIAVQPRTELLEIDDQDKQRAKAVASIESLAVAGLQCNVYWNIEHWGDPLIWGDSHKTRSEGECCAACYAHRATAARGGLDKGVNSTTCNTWVYCGDKERCGVHYGDCWLKHQPTLPPPDTPRPTTGPAMWTSGLVYDEAVVAQAYDKYNKLTIHTTVGDIVITLMPELAPETVRELRREVLILSERGGGCGGCKLYRAEDFGIQGILLNPGCYLGNPAKGHPGPADPKRKIPPGYVCRAGVGGSPHFFINFFEADWGDALCWGRVDDLELSTQISKRPLRAKQNPSELSLLAEELYFNMTIST